MGADCVAEQKSLYARTRTILTVELDSNEEAMRRKLSLDCIDDFKYKSGSILEAAAVLREVIVQR